MRSAGPGRPRQRARATTLPTQTAPGGGQPATGPCGVRWVGTGLVATPGSAGDQGREHPDRSNWQVWAEAIHCRALYCQARGQPGVRLNGSLRPGGTARVSRDQRRAMTTGAGSDPGQGPDHPATGRSRRPGGAGALGRRPCHWARATGRRLSPWSNTPVVSSSSSACPTTTQRRPGRRGRAMGRLPGLPQPVADLGPGHRDGPPRQVQRGHRHPGVLLRSRAARGSAAATRTPTASCASTCPREPTCPPTPGPTSTTSHSSSTTAPDKPSRLIHGRLSERRNL